MLYKHPGHFFCGLVVSFVVTGGRSWSFQNLNFEVKTDHEKLFVLISIIRVLIGSNLCIS